MKIEQQVCSLKPAKKLEELGVKQESLFYYSIDSPEIYHIRYWKFETVPTDKQVSAYTVAELEIYLPTNVVCQNTSFGEVLVKLLDEEGETIYFTREENGADARAKMLCYLVENKLITI